MMLNYSKLSQVKKGIVKSAFRQGYVGDFTYTREKEWLMRQGWLQGYCDDGVHIISGRWMLTKAAWKVVSDAM